MTAAELESEMAKRFYGYGTWMGRCWFIGPEEGKSKNEAREVRANAWAKRGMRDLEDCHQFHKAIDISWDEKLQPTWGSLICATLAFLGLSPSVSPLAYQRTEWGSSLGKTCLAELSGLGAANFKATTPSTHALLPERLTYLVDKVKANEPAFVIIYGTGRKKSCDEAWRVLTSGAKVEVDGIFKIAKVGKTMLVRAPHPKASKTGNTHAAWRSLGIRLQELSKTARGA